MNIEKKAGLILRFALGITFIVIGIFILKNPAGWGASVAPWVDNLLPGDIKNTMIANGIFDIVIGAWLIIGIKVWIAGLLAAIHLVLVLIATGANPITVRDIGLLGAAIHILLTNKDK